jgi:hypothetical protein
VRADTITVVVTPRAPVDVQVFAKQGRAGPPGTTNYDDLENLPTLGTVAALDVAASGDAADDQVVLGNDSRLDDARAPTAHSHAISGVTGLQTALDAKADRAGLAAVATSGADTDVSSSGTGFVGATVHAVLVAVFGVTSTLTAGLASLVATVAALTSSSISNASSVVGSTVTAALNTLATAYTAVSSALTAHTSNTSNPHAVTAAQIGVAAGATANATDAQLRDRSTHTGTQAISTVTGLQTALDAKAATSSLATVATSGSDADVSTSGTGWVGTTVRAVLTAISSAYSSLSTALTTHTSDIGNPHLVTAAQVGAVPVARTVSTTAPLNGGGPLSGNLALSISAASGSADGTMSSADFTKLASVASGAQVCSFTNVNAALAVASATINVNAKNVVNVAQVGLGTVSPTHACTFATGSSMALYNTADQTLNYARVTQGWSGGLYRIQSEAGGSGTQGGIILGLLNSSYLQQLNTGLTLSNVGSSIATTMLAILSANALVSTNTVQVGLSVGSTVNQTSGTGGFDAILVNPTLTSVGAAGCNLARLQVGSVDMWRADRFGHVFQSTTVTPAGTTGAQTINKPSGTVNFAAGATSLTVTNSLVSAASNVQLVLRTNDATARLGACVAAAGSFTINMTSAPTAETSVGFEVKN